MKKKKYLIDMNIKRNEAGEICQIEDIKIMNINDEILYDKNDAVYYAASKRSFFLRDGFDLAKKEGKSTVIVEYLP